MTRTQYYCELKALAADIRQSYGLNTPRVIKSDLRRIYRDYGIHIDLWPPKGIKSQFRNLRGAYLNDAFGSTVVVNRYLPDEPAIFTLGHELKHHLVDEASALYCDRSNENQVIEIGAEVFSAELIFPDEDFISNLNGIGAGSTNLQPEDIVHLKHNSRTTLSYQSLVKKAEYHGLIKRGIFVSVAWKKLEESIYGEPIYKRLQRKKSISRVSR